MSEEEKRKAEREAGARALIRDEYAKIKAEEKEAAGKADAAKKAKEEAERKAAEEKRRSEEDDELGIFGL